MRVHGKRRLRLKAKAQPKGESGALLESAKAFLVEALRNHSKGKVTFAILHGVTAVELVLKSRLARVHPSLVRKNIDAKLSSREATVGLSNLPQRLANLDLPLDPKGVGMIARFARWRNEIVHHAPSFDKHKARVEVPTLLNFIAEYLDAELGTGLKDFLPRELYPVALKELEKWQRLAANAAGRAQAEGNVLPISCPDCGARGVVVERKGRRAYCHLCDFDNLRIVACAECGRDEIVDARDSFDSVVCDDCMEGGWIDWQGDSRESE